MKRSPGVSTSQDTVRSWHVIRELNGSQSMTGVQQVMQATRCVVQAGKLGATPGRGVRFRTPEGRKACRRARQPRGMP